MSEDYVITTYEVRVVQHEEDLIILLALKIELRGQWNVHGPWKLTRANEESYSEHMEGLQPFLYLDFTTVNSM